MKKGRKIYFYDNGIRNSIIKNFKLLELRHDTGALWENYLIIERMKFNEYNQRFINSYFWRTHSRQEIDYIEEYDGILHAYEFKWNQKSRVSFPKSFIKAYPNSEFKIIHRENYEEFIFNTD
ncbi:MAG: DUF4143 domain-containing protein [Melioribacteraceae bacterium]|nr:DUF4143 domain-containing protein [Melioribacteraceae bacterium]MCF8262999.1 DUF4143 domain-containing protein [Melioribacteraceae bacterium]MCF8413993.1 DUF4143 domain-containing protein [Melioribacteraceae bacterium]MCF8430444.1 DUF4143 domain-containing protein [Melioribacteraceae bacterium]